MVEPIEWVLIRYNDQQYAIYSGNYDTWRRSSPIQSVEETEYGWEAKTLSSTYKLHLSRIGWTDYMRVVWYEAIQLLPSAELIPDILDNEVDISRAFHNYIKYRNL